MSEIGRLAISAFPYTASDFEVLLSDKPPAHKIGMLDFSKYKSVYSNKTYIFKLLDFDAEEVESIEVLINDEKQPINYNDGVISFPDYGTREKWIFHEKFGFVYVEIVVTYTNGERKSFYTDYLSVLIPKSQSMQAVDLMLSYVHQNQKDLLMTAAMGSKKPADLEESRFIGLESRLALADDILRQYKSAFGYFSANSRFKTKTVEIVDDTNKLQRITPSTLEFISTHPSLLNQTGSKSGIQIGHQRYVPGKTLIEKKVYSVNIYENQVVVGFIKKVQTDLELIHKELSELVEIGNNAEVGDYIHSSYCLFSKTEQTLTIFQEQIKGLISEINNVYGQYLKALEVDRFDVVQMPKPSPIFLSVPQYHSIYTNIYKWFNYGAYNLENEKFMMSFMDTSSLYEVYTLSKIIEAIKAQGYNLSDQYRYQYPIDDGFFENTLCNNTFTFVKKDETVDLFYQPVIKDGFSKSLNGIGIYKNNTITSKRQNNYGPNNYYTPDYLMRYTYKGKSSYAVLDAKYSSRQNVQENQLVECIFKYLFSISPDADNIIEGMYLLFGQGIAGVKSGSIYDRIKIDTIRQKSADLISITPGVEQERHLSRIAEIVKRLETVIKS